MLITTAIAINLKGECEWHERLSYPQQLAVTKPMRSAFERRDHRQNLIGQ
jgi:hypothetical protein